MLEIFLKRVQELIVISKQDLQELMESSVRRVLREHFGKIQETEEDKILSLPQACEYLQLAKQTIYGYTSNNTIPYFKRSKKLLFKKSDLQKWLLENRHDTLDEMRDSMPLPRRLSKSIK